MKRFFFFGRKRWTQSKIKRKLSEKRVREPREIDEESGEENKIKIKDKSKFSDKREREKRERESDEGSVEKVDVGIPLRHYSKYCVVAEIVYFFFCNSCSTVIQYWYYKRTQATSVLGLNLLVYEVYQDSSY